MPLKIVWIALLVTLCFGKEGSVDVGGYGEVYTHFSSVKKSTKVGRLIVEPSLKLSETLILKGMVGFEHPAENGGFFEAEIEVLSLDGKVSENLFGSLGKVHVPVGLYNLYHEPIYFLTLEPSRVEGIVIPAEWHETAALLSYTSDEYTYTMGAMTPMDVRKLERQSWIREGKEEHVQDGGRPAWVVRVDKGDIRTLLLGASAVTTPLSGSRGQATLIEAHATMKLENGWEGMALYSKGWIDHLESVNAVVNTISKMAEGGSATIGYDVGRVYGLGTRKLVTFGHTEYARPAKPHELHGLGGVAYSCGVNWFFTPHVVAKGEWRTSSLEGERVGVGIGFVY